MLEEARIEIKPITTTIPVSKLMMENRKAPLAEILLKHARSINPNEHHNICFTQRNVDVSRIGNICIWYEDPHWDKRNIPTPPLPCMYGHYKKKYHNQSLEKCMNRHGFQIIDLDPHEPIPAYVIFRFEYGVGKQYKNELELFQHFTDKVNHMPLYLGKEGRRFNDSVNDVLVLIFPSTLEI